MGPIGRPNGQVGIATPCCVISQKSTDHNMTIIWTQKEEIDEINGIL
jgi:hypothetical protein